MVKMVIAANELVNEVERIFLTLPTVDQDYSEAMKMVFERVKADDSAIKSIIAVWDNHPNGTFTGPEFMEWITSLGKVIEGVRLLNHVADMTLPTINQTPY